MPKFSIIVPVYNRPDEIDELLKSLSDQSHDDFEVILVEDGSTETSEEVVSKYKDLLAIRYFIKENKGQGFSRNFASKYANGEWLVFLDSDCMVPAKYLSNLNELVADDSLDALCGPDRARRDFSILQRAISYSMTSFLTTGGIRGKKVKLDQSVHLRSYNLVMRKEVFEELGGFRKTNMGEDMELSHRFSIVGKRAIISDDIMVYHKRRNSLLSFFEQIFSFGRTRVQLKCQYEIPIKFVHYFPFAFTMGLIAGIAGIFVFPVVAKAILSLYGVYFFLIFVHATWSEKSPVVGFVSVITSFIQHVAYGMGFIAEVFHLMSR